MADKTEKKPGFVARMKGFGANIAKFFRDTKSELKKVVWPDAKTTAKNTGTVLLCSVAVGACIWIFDGVAYSLIQAILSLFQG